MVLKYGACRQAVSHTVKFLSTGFPDEGSPVDEVVLIFWYYSECTSKGVLQWTVWGRVSSSIGSLDGLSIERNIKISLKVFPAEGISPE